MVNNNRKERIFTLIENKIDAIIIKNNIEPNIDDNFLYFTGLEEGIFEGCCAILFPQKTSQLLITQLEQESAKKSNYNINLFDSKKTFENHIIRLLSSTKNIGLNFNNISYKDYLFFTKLLPNTRFFDISKEITMIRQIKDNDEIKKISQACKIVDKVMSKIPNIIYKGMTENQLAAEIDFLMQKMGAKKPAFTTIASFGKNSAEPHYSHGNVKLKKGDFILCDFGANYKNYNSDITRTFIFNEAKEKQIAMHKTIIKAQNIAFQELKSDVEAKKIHKKVLAYINKTKFKSLFIHSTGHSIGLRVHDVGLGISLESDIHLKENMVFTIEPGIYLPKYGGIRIEDDVIIKKDGYELLTKSNRDLIII